MNSLISLRKKLHANAETSHHEKKTQTILKNYLKPFGAQIIELAKGKAFAAVFDSKIKGLNIGFRADMDALPIDETIAIEHQSNHQGVSHKCGHDGHMALVCSLANAWTDVETKSGKLILLFQHAEETGEGAQEIIEDEKFLQLGIDRLYGFHNIPKENEKTLIYNDDVFACASEGLKFILKGKSSHASEPEFARSPIAMLIETINFVKSIESTRKDDAYFIATLVWCKIGNENYGISPGDAQIAFTLRSKSNSVITKNKEKIIEYVKKLAQKEKIKLEVDIKDPFPATVVSKALVDFLTVSAKNANLRVQYKDFPFSWSEDFGHYAKKVSSTAYFGLGIGQEHSELHSPEYDFADKMIQPYANFLKELWTYQMKAIN